MSPNWRGLLGHLGPFIVHFGTSKPKRVFSCFCFNTRDLRCIFVVSSVLIMIQEFKTCVHNFYRYSVQASKDQETSLVFLAAVVRF